MKLLMSPLSPFVRKVLVTLRETDQASDVTYESVTASPTGPDASLIAANPLGKIPALVREDGPTLYDSRVICRYFDARANAGLYPEKRIWDTLTLEATADGIMDAAVSMVSEARFRPEALQSSEWVEAQWTKVDRALTVLDTRWMSHLQGPLDMGQIAVGCALGYLDLRHDARNWRGGRDSLAAWGDAFMSRDSMRLTKPEA
jgi:glutathione S-transferase